MKSRFLFILKYSLFWILIFILQKLMFLVFNLRESLNLKAYEWFLVILHGLRLDISATGYLLVIPVVLMIVLCFFDIKITRISLRIYNYIFLFFVLYLGVVDMEMYSYWGIKVDITPLIYLKTPKEAAASLNLIETTLLFILLIGLYYAGLKFYNRFILSGLENTKPSWKFSLPGIFLLGFLMIPIRGGIGIAPINLGAVYFHPNRFANHAAINVLWNAMYSIVERKNLNSEHHFMDASRANEYFNRLNHQENSGKTYIKKNANVVLIILESFSNKIISELGGEEGITPRINDLCKSSLVFRNFYASGDRSEKGMLSIFSGYPAQPTTTIINYPSKTQKLPFLTEEFHKNGYSTSFYYGGDMNFANFQSYFVNPFMDRIISLADFPSEQNLQKWGVPDEFLFEKLFSDIDTITRPFFVSCFTLSSHEPYDIPGKLREDTRDNLSKRAFSYTDKCLGNFIEKVRKSKWWDNTLIIIIADHGSRTPGNTPNHTPEKFNIPMLWTGGALEVSPSLVYNFCSQTDLAKTLLNQFQFPSDNYKFSRDIFSENNKSFAMYFFNNGFGFMSDSSKLIYDINIHDYIYASGLSCESDKEPAKGYMQVLSGDFYSR